ncbi:MAG: sigma-70 family RNA polymerase sigma factor [Synechococcaceae cyanobacterium SM2_3_1]|nr:sigma-70 family RNA polymerase sigma factor [Synechococcaceae cyanobacterium SM2_3_1]
MPNPSRQATEKETDQQLVKRCLEGDQQSFRLLYRRHQARVRSILYQLCGGSHLDDLVQEVFLRAWKGLRGFRHSAQFSTWLYRIAWNLASDQRRRYAQQRSQLQSLAQATPLHHDDPGVMQLHYQQILQAGLAQLSWEHRTVIVLHDLQEQPQKEIAVMLGIPVGTVKSRLFHARAALRQFLHHAGVSL